MAMVDWVRNGPAWQVYGCACLLVVAFGLFRFGAARRIKAAGYVCLFLALICILCSLASNEIKRASMKDAAQVPHAGRDSVQQTGPNNVVFSGAALSIDQYINAPVSGTNNNVMVGKGGANDDGPGVVHVQLFNPPEDKK